MQTVPQPSGPTYGPQPPAGAGSPASGRGFRSAEDFSRLVTPHLPALVRRATAILRSADLAEDAVQETLVRVWVRGWLPAHARPALERLVALSCRHQARCERRRRYHEGLHAPAVESPSTTDSAVAADCCASDPLASLEAADRRTAVRNAIACLSADQRAVVTRFELEQQSYETIAHDLALPIGTVRSRLNRGRAKLREHLLVAVGD